VARKLGTWAIGKIAEIILPIKSVPNEILTEVRPFVTPVHSSQRAIVKINGIHVIEHTTETVSNNLLAIPIPNDISANISEKGFIFFELELPTAISPKELNLPGDTRTLSVGIIAVTFK
jgi:hypothetical protein